MKNFSLAIHGGAGTYKKFLSPDREKEFETALNVALKIGHEILAKGGTSLDAVEATVRNLEDCPLFNAGRGSVFNHEGKIEMDAAIMDGQDKSAGAVAFVTTVKNPVTLARKVMEKTDHVMLAGEGAEKFAREVGAEIVDPSWFFTQYRWESWQKLKDKDETELNLGTVGAVALDQHGNLAAATSTGGMNNKKYGRIGDSPIVGAGLYADNNTCAVSSTGHGEYFIRLNLAYDISALMDYKHLVLEVAANEAIQKLTALGGSGGVIAVDKLGNVAMSFCTDTMFRGFIKEDGVPHPFIFDTYSKIL
jgi:beta-aspartyl-peptidase (threonine type)